MLAGLLPGLRDLRTPLASGYIWLLALWVSLRPNIENAVRQTGPMAELYQDSQFLGRSVWLGTLSFVAFLLGSLLQVRIVRDGGRIRRFGRGHHDDPQALPSAAARRRASSVLRHLWRSVLNYRQLYDLYFQLDALVRTRLTLVRGGVDLDHPERETLGRLLRQREESLTFGAWILAARRRPPDPFKATPTQLYIEAISFELDSISIQLQAKNRDLWDTYDRHCAEEQFRHSVSPALLVLTVALAYQSGQPAWLAALLLPAILFLHGLRHSAAATSVLVQAVVLNIVRPDVLPAPPDETESRASLSWAPAGRDGA